MADLTFILTTAGLNALVNPANTGTNAITVDRVGVSAVTLPGAPESNIGLTQLPNELKRVATFGGGIVGDNTIHVTIRDESADIYQLRTFGLYSAGGVLLAFYTQPLPIMEKAASSMLLLSADLQFTTPIAAELVFGDTNFMNPPATTSQQGVVELATAPETAEGTDATRAVTPFGLKSLLTALLAGFSPTGHTHAAGDIVSGVLNVARIPDLAQSKITGLVDALAGKAASVHSHVMADVTGLVAALGLKLAIADFTWQNLVGKPNVAINGLDASFAALLSQGSPVWTSGNFNPNDKAAALHSHSWAQITGKPDVVVNGQISIAARGATDAGFTLIVGGNADVTGITGFYLGDGTRMGWIGQAHKTTKAINIVAENGAYWLFDQRPSFAGATPWDSANFNPADKAAAIHSHDWAQITGKPDLVINGQGSITARGSAGFGAVTLSGGNAGFSGFVNWYLPGGTRVGYLGEVDPANKRINFITENGGSFYFLSRPSFAGATPWDSGNFNPADKAPAVHSHDWAQITGSRASAAEYRSNANDRALTPNGVWAAAALVGAAQAATIAIDMATGLNFSTTMTGNRILGAPANAKPGQSGVIELLQDATGGRTLTFNAAWKFEGGTPPTLSTAANARDILVFTVISANFVVASLIKAVS